MQMLFYIGLSGNHAESSLATVRYLPQNIRFAGEECYANHCRLNREGQPMCQKFYMQVSKMQQSDVPPKKGSLRSHVWSKDTQGEEAANNKANHKNDNFLNCD